jgi:hypothetical protein
MIWFVGSQACCGNNRTTMMAPAPQPRRIDDH